jgi:predicted transport protein
MCIAEAFNKFDVDTADVLLPVFRVELIRYRAYEDGIFSLEPLQIVSEPKTETAPAPDSELAEEITAEKYSVETHLAKALPEIREIFEELRSRIKALGPEVVERPRQIYIGYRASKNFAEVHIQKSALLIDLRPIEYEDPEGRITKIPESYRWTLDRQVTLTSHSDLDYAMSLVEQSYNDVA